MQASLRIYNHIPSTRALGPFERFALWVQGCPFSCRACMAPGAQPGDGGELWAIEELVRIILNQRHIEGITISGGEPFMQAAGVCALLREIRQNSPLGVIVYSGYLYSDLLSLAKRHAAVAGVLQHTDLLIDGPYKEEENDNASLKGSSNQKAHLLTPRYSEWLHLYESTHKRAMEVHVHEQDTTVVGVPSKEQLAWWQRYKNTQVPSV